MTGIIAHLLNEPVTVTPRSGASTDAYGNTVFGNGTQVQTVGFLEQTDSTETLTDRDTTITDWVCYLPAETSIGPHDRVTFGSGTFEVVGQPALLWNPRAQAYDHIECHLREIS